MCLAAERNTIHCDGSPLQHGEQRALRTATGRVSAKRPRQPAQAVEAYYRSSMVTGKGTTPEDFLNVGGTLYTTLEPCPMCASSPLVCRVKRVVFLLADRKYGGAWRMLKAPLGRHPTHFLVVWPLPLTLFLASASSSQPSLLRSPSSGISVNRTPKPISSAV